MSRDADYDTLIDEAIDVVAAEMTDAAAPDVRPAVRARLERPSAGAAWWQPALAAAVLALVLIAWWPARQGDQMPDPAAVQPPARVAEQPPPAPSAPSSVASAEPARALSRRTSPVRTARRESIDWPPPATAIEPLDVRPVRIEPIESTPITVPAAEIPTLVVEPLAVEPLPRSDR